MNVDSLALPVKTFGLLVLSNLFMTWAWYGHLKTLGGRPWLVAALASWGIALFEYLLQVPANRLGYTVLSLGQLKVMQEVITLAVFAVVARPLSMPGSMPLVEGLPPPWSCPPWLAWPWPPWSCPGWSVIASSPLRFR